MNLYILRVMRLEKLHQLYYVWSFARLNCAVWHPFFASNFANHFVGGRSTEIRVAFVYSPHYYSLDEVVRFALW